MDSVDSEDLLDDTWSKAFVFLTASAPHSFGIVPGSHTRHLLSCALVFKYDDAAISGIEGLALGLDGVV